MHGTLFKYLENFIYESYDDYFPYKLEITGAEYWEGEKWISV